MVTPVNRILTLVVVVAGIALLALAVVYWSESAARLPAFLPGHEAGSTTRHVKHGIAAMALALGLFALAWFRTGPARPGAVR